MFYNWIGIIADVYVLRGLKQRKKIKFTGCCCRERKKTQEYSIEDKISILTKKYIHVQSRTTEKKGYSIKLLPRAWPPRKPRKQLHALSGVVLAQTGNNVHNDVLQRVLGVVALLVFF